MSILRPEALAVAPSTGISLEAGVILAFLVLVCLSGAVATGLLRARSVSGPLRLERDKDAPWRLMVSAFAACFIWALSQTTYIALRQIPSSHGNAAASTQPATGLSVVDQAVLSTVPALLGLAVGLIFDRLMLGRVGLARLGITSKPFRFLPQGALGILLVFPLVFVVAQASDALFNYFHYVHPQEHELLKVMADSGGGPIRLVLIIGAVAIAPCFEELLFRAHIQTWLREMFCRVSGVLVIATAPAIGSDEIGATVSSPSHANSTSDAPVFAVRNAAWQTWLAIVLTSTLFALVHPAWMRPTIFFLSLCLGFAYERTGSLWTSIWMHAAFNAMNTYLFLHAER